MRAELVRDEALLAPERQSEAQGGDAPSVAFFGHDANESTVRKRIASFEAEGWTVRGFTFARSRYETRHAPQQPFWPNVPLGQTQDRNYPRRMKALAAAVPRVLRHAPAIRSARAIYARNMDMMALAALARRLTGSRARLVYEVLDVQRPLLRKGAAGAAMRMAERRLLAEADLLVVSAPEFVERYFDPVQGYRGPWHLLENKLAPAQLQAQPDAFARGPRLAAGAGPWVIGWFGVLRCARSLALLERIAERLGDRVRVVLRGRLSEEDISRDALGDVLRRRNNIHYDGPYASPADLAGIYGGVHFSWSVDYIDAGANSDWLLPNRIYEGGFFGTPAIARGGTATGRMIAENGLGHALPEPLEDSVCNLLRTLEPAEYERQRQEIRAKPRSLFVDDGQVAALMARMAGAA